MKKVLTIITAIAFMLTHFTVKAQDEKANAEKLAAEKKMQDADILKQKAEKDLKETQEIIIRKKGDKDEKITVEINGDNVTINGKPISEFKDGEININKRKMIIKDGKRDFESVPDNMEVFLNNKFNSDAFGGNSVKRGFLGVTTQEEKGEDKNNKTEGAIINTVAEGSAAEKAGLKSGDIITKINEVIVINNQALSKIVGSFKPKDEVTVHYKREGKSKYTKAILGETSGIKMMVYSVNGPNGFSKSFSMPNMPDMQNSFDIKDFKMNMDRNEQMNKLTFPRQQKLGLKIQDTEDGNGVKVLDTDKDSPAEKAGLQKDDIVTEIAETKINNTDEARKMLAENGDKMAYTIKAKRNGTEMNFDIKIPKKLKTANL